MKNMYLGVDAGSISLNAALIDENKKLIASSVVLTHGRTTEALKAALAELLGKVPDANVAAVCCTGSGRDLLADQLQAVSVNEITAHAMGTAPLLPDKQICSLLEIGGQDSKFITLKRHGETVEVLDHAMNTLCAAGTGTFFDGQAARLGITVAALADLAEKAKRAAHIAGRCVVFSKTDIIHHQQSGTGIDEVARGLCDSAARNIMGTLIHGRTIHKPLFFTGGVAANLGMRRALSPLFKLSREQLIVPENYRILGAIGSAIRAHEEERDTDHRRLDQIVAGLPSTPEKVTEKAIHQRQKSRSTLLLDQKFFHTPQGRYVDIGFDMGSVSIKWAVLYNGHILDDYYAFTQGRPLEALAEAFAALKNSPVVQGKRIRSVGVTGSGRKLTARLLGADCVINEITAHTTAIRALDPGVDTLFEIGGQDAKYVRFEGNRIKEFAMNTACSAGTGSLILEESKRLGIEVSQLDEIAVGAEKAADLQDRCTVFIDSDLVSRMQQGVPIEELACGLLHAVARNYIERVVAHRNPGENIVFAGGVSRSRVVTRELSRLTGKKVIASPWGASSGAIGAAMIAGERASPDNTHELFSRIIAVNSKQTRAIKCKGCAGACSVQRLKFDDIIFFSGDACGCWSEKTDKEPDPIIPRTNRTEDIFDKRIRLWDLEMDSNPITSGKIAIPRAHQTWDMFPFLKTFFSHLNLETGLSLPTTRSSIQEGISLSRSEQCMPVKIALSHANTLLDSDISALFIPIFGETPQDPRIKAPIAKRLISCIYSLQLGSVVQATLKKKADAKNIPILHPSIPMNDEREKLGIRTLHKVLQPLGSFSPRQIKRAFRAGKARLNSVREQSIQLGIQTLREATAEHPVVVLFGRSYTLYDPVLNIQIARRLERLGLTPIPYDTILAAGIVPDKLSHMQWRIGTEHIQAAVTMRISPHAHPLFLSYYGCGPDAFIAKNLRQVMGERRSLHIELDGHNGDAGLETRLEAFADAIRSTSVPQTPFSPGKQNIPLRHPEHLKGRTIALPYFADHVYAFAGAIERAGMPIIMMPPATDATRLLGERYSEGGECSPYAMILGDLVKWAQDKSLPQNKKGFFIPSAKGPCLLGHYAHAFTRVLDKVGASDLLVWNPYGSELSDVVPMADLIDLWRGIIACDYLWRWSVALHPYGTVPGAVRQAKKQALEGIQEGVREGTVFRKIHDAVALMNAIPVDTTTKADRIKVGIVGDIYTRVNPLANQGLYHQLEKLGCQVLAPPFMLDGQLYDAWTDPIQDYFSKRYTSAVKRIMLSAFQINELVRVRRLFPDDPAVTYDGRGLDWYRDTSRYCNNQSDGYLAQNLGRTLDFIRMGADGILSVMCHNCMVGLTSDALFPEIRDDFGDIPITSLSYDAIGDTHINTRLEAFVELLKTRRKYGLSTSTQQR